MKIVSADQPLARRAATIGIVSRRCPSGPLSEPPSASKNTTYFFKGHLLGSHTASVVKLTQKGREYPTQG